MQVTDRVRATPSARQRAYDYIRSRILSGKFPSDSFLEEEQVSALIGVSRTPVREAFQRLEGEQLIELVPRRGARVRGVSLREVTEFFEVRRVIEGHVVRELCRTGQEAPAAMERLLNEMCQLPAEAGLRYVRLDRAFHGALVAALGNKVLVEMFDALAARQHRLVSLSLRIQPRRPILIHEQHKALLQAIKAGDVEAALQVLDIHLQPLDEVWSALSR